ncbi:MAG: hypothetical protein GY761_16900, partial [Hyphomicrobiales bacterium]|nr:hypothetical protein [Hyphomicrobiales bacterium]
MNSIMAAICAPARAGTRFEEMKMNVYSMRAVSLEDDQSDDFHSVPEILDGDSSKVGPTGFDFSMPP